MGTRRINKRALDPPGSFELGGKTKGGFAAFKIVQRVLLHTQKIYQNLQEKVDISVLTII